MKKLFKTTLTDDCPACGSDLRGAAVPEKSREFYAPGTTHFLRWIGLYDMNQDRVTHYRCPECEHVQERT